MFGLRYLKDVVTLELDPGRCVGCGACLDVCPHGVFALDGDKARIVDRDACMECGACARNCAEGAIRVEAGVGCAVAIVNAALGRKSSKCCCAGPPADGGSCHPRADRNVP